MRIHIKLRGPLAARLPMGQDEIEVPDGATIAAVLERFEVPAVACICLVNGSPATRGTPLREGDRVQIVPPIAGG
jgi:sulfur carrier protein ThiS